MKKSLNKLYSQAYRHGGYLNRLGWLKGKKFFRSYFHYSKKFIFFGLVFCLLITAGCGFKPRGDFQFPSELKTLYLETSKPYGFLSKNLRAILKTANVTLTTSAKAAPITLQIIKESMNQTIISIGTNSTTIEYLLSYAVTYQLTDAQGTTIAGPFNAINYSNFATTSNQMLSSSYAQASLQESMEQQLAIQILNVLLSKNTLNAINMHNKTLTSNVP